MKRLFYLLIACSVIHFSLQSCVENKELEIPASTENVNAVSAAEYDAVAEDLALAVSKAVQNSTDFRKLVKTEVVKQFDGDYDLLMTNCLSTRIAPSADLATRASENFTVKDMLECYLPERATRASGSVLDDIQKKYPNLQIAVPVHAEEWDAETYTPVVCFIPSDFVDTETQYVTGIDAEGNSVQVDAINEPDKPVIVIGMNERAGIARDWTSGGGTLPPFNPYIKPKLSGTFSSGGAKLTWDSGSLGTITIKKYYIYRSGPNNDGNYTLISTVGATVRSYNDYNIVANSEYYYKVTASEGFSKQIASDPIVIVTNSNGLQSVKDLIAEPIDNWRMQLEWSNPVGENYTTQIQRRVAGVDSDYEVIANVAPTENMYIDNDSYPGQKQTYLVKKIDTQGRQSATVKTFNYATYRDPESLSKVYIKQITCDLAAIESWIVGKPEFTIKVLTVNETGVASEVNSYYVEFDKRSGVSQILNNALLHNWQYLNDSKYYPALTFSLLEEDFEGTFTINVGVAAGVKVKDAIELNTSLSLGVTFKTGGQYCGQSSILYYEDPDKWLQFPSYSTAIHLSELP